MQTTPLSASTIAPASKVFYPVSRSVTIAAVKPTPLAPLPVVPIPTSTVLNTHLKIWLFAVPGSPTINILISPLKWVPFSSIFSQPPRSINNTAFFKWSCPYIEGAIDLLKSPKSSDSTQGIFEVILAGTIEMLRGLTERHKKKGLKIPFYLLIAPGISL